MASKSDQHEIKLTGPGLSFERPVSEEIANRIINLVMTGEAGTPASEVSTGVSVRAAPEATGKLTSKQFIAQKRPSTDYERVVCLAYYLAHSHNTPTFKTSDIRKLSTDAALHFSNIPQAVMHATATYHYLAKAGGGNKQITILGEAVVEALPDREKVKAAIAEHKSKPRRKRRKRTK